VNGCVEATDSNVASFNFLVGSFDSLQELHQLSNCWLGLLFLTNVLACVVEQVKFFKEVDMGCRFPTDMRTRGVYLRGGSIVCLDRVPNCLATALQRFRNVCLHMMG
jgi:hypothetical protein